MRRIQFSVLILAIIQAINGVVLFSPIKAHEAAISCPPSNFTLTSIDASATPHSLTWNLFPMSNPTNGLPGKIVFMSNRDMSDKQRYQLYVMNADGSDTIRLTHDQYDYWFPSVSPNGKHIAFGSDRCGGWHLFMMDPDGRNVVMFPVVGSGYINYRPAWSPDNKRIAFTMNNEIYAMNIDGSGLVDLTNNPANDQRPSWSPDGKYILFGSSRAYRFGYHLLDNQIFVMNVDGSNQTQLTHYESDRVRAKVVRQLVAKRKARS